MTYYINAENTGLYTDDQVRTLAAVMQADGHDVEFTADHASIKKNDDNGDAIVRPVSEQAWMRYVALVAAGLRTS